MCDVADSIGRLPPRRKAILSGSQSKEMGALSTPPPLTLNERLRAAETEWLAETSPDFVSFELFKRYPPKPMRRHNSITGGLAEITFGGGENPEGMSLLMLISEVPGSGHALLERIKQIADRHDLSIEADVKPLKPTNWNPERRFVSLGRHLNHGGGGSAKRLWKRVRSSLAMFLTA